jgi:hypothetical protein
VSYREESVPQESLLLAVVADDTSRLLCHAALPLAGVVPGLHYNLKLLFPPAAPVAGQPAALYVTLCLQPAARTQARALQRSALAAGGGAPQLLQARLAGTATPLVHPGQWRACAELWAVWRPLCGPATEAAEAGHAPGAEAIDIASVHLAVDASNPSAVESALRRASAAVLGAPSAVPALASLAGPAAPGGGALPRPPALAGGARLLPPFQALPLQRCGTDGGDPGGGDAGGLLWPPDHMALLPLPGQGGRGGGGCRGAVLELHMLEYGPRPGSRGGGSVPAGGDAAGADAGSTGGDGAAPSASGGRAVAALLRARSAHTARASGAGGVVAPQPGRLLTSRLVARLELGARLLAWDRPGERLVLEGLALAAPGGGSLGAATVEAVPWDLQSFLGHLAGLAGPTTGVASTAAGGQTWPSAFGGSGVLPGPGGLPQAAARACVRSGAALLVDTLARDMVAKQAALERLQRHADVAGARLEAAGARLRDAQSRNRWGGGAALATIMARPALNLSGALQFGGCWTHAAPPGMRRPLSNAETTPRPHRLLSEEAQRLRGLLQEEKTASLAPAAGPDGDGGAAPAVWASPLGAEPTALTREQLLSAAEATLGALQRERRRNAELVHRLQQLHAEQVNLGAGTQAQQALEPAQQISSPWSCHGCAHTWHMRALPAARST